MMTKINSNTPWSDIKKTLKSSVKPEAFTYVAFKIKTNS